MVVTGSTRNRFVLLIAGHVGSNPTLSAKFCIAKFGEISPFLTPRSGYSVFVKNPRPRVGILYFFQIAERCPSWLKERDWKSRVLLTVVPRVRIPLSPPNFAMQNLARSRQFVLQIGGSAIFNSTFWMPGF